MLRIRAKFPVPEALRSHLWMTHRQYVADVRGGKALAEMHRQLHVDMEEVGLPNGTVPHFHA